jgi:hypothetical protein
MILFLWWKTQHWRWWMRFVRPVEIINTTGCHNDEHISTSQSYFMDICPCVDPKQFALYQRGYRVAAWREQGAIYTDGKNVIYGHHSYGR